MLLLCSTPGGEAEEERRHRADPVPPISTGPCIRWLSRRHRHNKPQFYGVLTVFCRWDPRWDPCVLPLIRADPGTFPVAGIWIRANSGAGIRSHLPAGPPGALEDRTSDGAPHHLSRAHARPIGLWEFANFFLAGPIPPVVPAACRG